MGPRPQREEAARPPRPQRKRPIYVRFVCFHKVEGQRSRLGLFQAIDVARESEQAEAWALAAIDDVCEWFNANLATPPQFDRDGVTPAAKRALSWFKPGAVEHVRRMHDLKAMLERCGVHVEVLTTSAPGIISYEDEHQITATPYGRKFEGPTVGSAQNILAGDLLCEDDGRPFPGAAFGSR